MLTGLVPSDALRESQFPASLLASGSIRHAVAYRRPSSSCVPTLSSLYSCLCLNFPFLWGHKSYWIRVQSNDLIWTRLSSQRPYFQQRLHQDFNTSSLGTQFNSWQWATIVVRWLRGCKNVCFWSKRSPPKVVGSENSKSPSLNPSSSFLRTAHPRVLPF